MTRNHLAVLSLCCMLAGIGCTPAPEVFPCYYGTDPLPSGLVELLGDDLTDCSQLDGMVCNGGVPVEEACIRAAEPATDGLRHSY